MVFVSMINIGDDGQWKKIKLFSESMLLDDKNSYYCEAKSIFQNGIW